MNTGRKTTGHAAAVITLGSIVGCGGVLRIPESEKARTLGGLLELQRRGPGDRRGRDRQSGVRPGRGIADEITVDVVGAALGNTPPRGPTTAAFAPARDLLCGEPTARALRSR